MTRCAWALPGRPDGPRVLMPCPSWCNAKARTDGAWGRPMTGYLSVSPVFRRRRCRPGVWTPGLQPAGEGEQEAVGPCSACPGPHLALILTAAHDPPLERTETLQRVACGDDGMPWPRNAIRGCGGVPYLDFPEVVGDRRIVLALVGFPIAPIVSWITTGGPDGISCTEEVSAEGAATAPGAQTQSGGFRDHRHPRRAAGGAALLRAGRYPEAAVEEARPTGIAVLPFVNMEQPSGAGVLQRRLTGRTSSRSWPRRDMHAAISRTTCMKFKGDTLPSARSAGS